MFKLMLFNIQEGEESLLHKPPDADGAIEILVNSYKSSNTSEVAKKEMRDINEMVCVLNLCAFI